MLGAEAPVSTLWSRTQIGCQRKLGVAAFAAGRTMVPMSVSRLEHITKIGVEDFGALADELNDPEILRLENLDTDLRPPQSAVLATQAAVEEDVANSYLPFVGSNELRRAATGLVGQQSGVSYHWQAQSLITAGGLSGILNVLLATLEPGDEVLMTDPIYVGLINRVRLAGGVPRFVPLIPSDEGWRLDLEALQQIDPKPVRAALMMSPSMPTGAVFNRQEWRAVVDFCVEADCWLINDSAMERILFDQCAVIHPASYPEIVERVITVGSASKEYRMIGWRVGWVVGPESLLADVSRVSITNVCCQSGIGMAGVAAAITDPDPGIEDCVVRWQARRDLMLNELEGLPVVPPHGGWSMLLNVNQLGFGAAEAANRLVQAGKVAVTPMVNWGSETASQYVRFVFSNESRQRLCGAGQRIAMALDR